MSSATDTRQTTRRHGAFKPVLLLVAALLWAQMLGLAHRVLHAPQLAAGPVWEQTAQLTPAAPAGLLGHLFAPGHGEPDCRAYDQLGLADTLPAMPVLGLPVLAPVFLDVALRVTVCRSRPVLFEARGPPTVR